MKRVAQWLSGLMGVDAATKGEARRRSTRSPATLAAAAGRAKPAGRLGATENRAAMWEPLELRQLMFNIVVTDVDTDPQFDNPFIQFVSAANGYATIQVDFGYVVPLYFRDDIPEPEANGADPVVNDLNDLTVNAGGGSFRFENFALGGNDGLRFTGQNASIRIIQTPGTAPEAQERSARITVDPNGTFVLYFPATSSPNVFIPVSEFIWDYATGVSPTNLAVDYLQVPQSGGGRFLQDITTNDPNLTGSTISFPGPGGPLQIGTFSGNSFPQDPRYFNVLRFRNTSSIATVSFTVDNFAVTPFATRFASFTTSRVFGASLRVTAPIGAEIEALDLYGRQLQATLGLIPIGDVPISPVDIDDNGVPDFNDGIGRISITGSDRNTQVTLIGYQYSFDTERGVYVRTYASSLTGFQDAFATAGFGYQIDIAGTGVTGLPPAAGSVIIGSPFIRDNTSPENYFGIDTTTQGGDSGFFETAGLNFTTQNLANNLGNLPNIPLIRMGVSVDADINSLVLHSTLHGLLSVGGSASRVNLSYLPGSVSVAGDAGAIVVASDVGLTVDLERPNVNVLGDNIFRTSTSIFVGRFLNQLQIGGRNAANVQVIGLANNANLSTLDYLRYDELERIYRFSVINQDLSEIDYFYLKLLELNRIAPGLEGLARSIETLDVFAGPDPVNNESVSPLFFGGGFYRNDSLNTAEFIGSGIRGAIISGTINSFNPLQSPDLADAYGFGAKKGQSLVFNVQGLSSGYARVVDADGRVLAAHQFPPLTGSQSLPPSGVNTRSDDARFVFTPKGDGVYYLVIGQPPTGGGVVSLTRYTVTMTGQASTALGLLSVSAGGRRDTLIVNNGGTGLYRVGAGVSNDAGDTPSTTPGGIESIETPQDLFDIRGSSINVAGDLFGIRTGSDVTSLTASIGGNLGTFVTGRLVGYSFDAAGLARSTSGDINVLTLKVGKAINSISTPQGLGWQTFSTGLKIIPNSGGGGNADGPIYIESGTTGAPGHIGSILVGNALNGQNFTLKTSADSVIDRFIIGEDTNASALRGVVAFFQPNFQLGAGSQIRFAEFSRVVAGNIGSTNTENFFIDVAFGQTINLTDENGTPFSITISGGRSAALAGASTARIRYLPVNGSTGVIIGTIDAFLAGGANLTIQGTGTGGGRIDIGRLNVATDVPAGNVAGSNIIFTGRTQIDVYRVVGDAAALTRTISGGGGGTTASAIFNQISNTTPGGDLVAIDVRALNTLTITGNLGRVESVNSIADTLIGPYLGLSTTLSTAANAPLFVLAGFNGISDIFEPIADGGVVSNRLENIGSPISGRLNGLVVRTGSVQRVSINGSVGDVMVLGGASESPNGQNGLILTPDGTLVNLIVNADARTTPGNFDGIVGTVFAVNIGTIDVGDGLRGPGEGPFAEAGIFATDDISRVTGGSRVRNPVINGIIIAANNTTTITVITNSSGSRTTFDTQGIGSIAFTSGQFDGAYIATATLDSWWRSAIDTPRFFVSGTTAADPPTSRGRINSFSLSNGNLKASTIFASDINTISITRGNFDASTVQAQTGNVNLVTADNFLNSTRDGEPLEYRFALIRVTGNLANVRTNGSTGTMSDLFIDVNGDHTGAISAFNIVRLSVTGNQTINQIVATNDVRGSTINAGRLNLLSARNNIRSSTITVAGLIQAVTATNEITGANINATGIGGQIGRITAGSNFSGQITTSGVLTALTATRGDISASIVANDTDAVITAISAGRDANVTISSVADIGTIVARRNVGRRLIGGGTPDAIETTANLRSITAGGQVYADVTVGQSITGLITIGRTFALPNAAADTDRDRVSDANIVAAGRIFGVTVTGDFAGSITAYSGGIGRITINAGSFRRYAPTVQTADPSLVNAITAFDGDIDSISITRGHLLGDVKALNGSIRAITLRGDANFGDIGIDPDKVVAANNPSPVDVTLSNSESRYRLPALPTGALGAGQDGPTIFAQYDILNLTASGRIYEATISAGRNITSITLGGADTTGPITTTPSAIIAGDSITRATFGINGASLVARGLFIGAGVTSLGADNLAGGVGANADTVESGDIGDVTFNGNIIDTRVSAGLNAGADGLYNTNDDLAAPGLSTIRSVRATGTATNSSAFAHTTTGIVTPATIATGGPALNSIDARVFTGSTAGFTAITAAGANFNVNGQTVNIRLTGAGQAFFDDITNAGTVRIILLGTTSASQLAFVGAVGVTTLNNLQIVSGPNASLQALSLPLGLTGNSAAYVDGTIGTLTLGNVNTNLGAPGIFQAGQGITTAVIGAVGNTSPNILRLVTNVLGSATFNGGLGDSSLTTNLSRLDAKSATTVTINGDHAGIISVDRDLTTLRVTGAVDEAGVRVGGSLTTFSAASLFRARIAARTALGAVTITGNVDSSLLYAGTDLGRDAAIGGSSLNTDLTGNGSIRSISIGGDFTASDIAAGVRRAAGAFLTNPTDRAADGRSSIGPVTIAGAAVGSAFSSQAFGIISNGTIGPVLVGGQTFAGEGNLRVQALANTPQTLKVVDLRVDQVVGIYTASIRFSQAIDFSSVNAALRIFEVRGSGANTQTSAALVSGLGNDYRLSYDPNTFTVTVEFSPAITDRPLNNNTVGFDTPRVDGSSNPLPSPGLYKFEINAALLRAQTLDQQLDGNGDGRSGDSYTGFDIVGDAGDRLRSATVVSASNPSALVPLFGPVDINPILGGAQTGVPVINSTATIRGRLGDHAYHNPTSFDTGADLDIYTFTAKAGQIIRLGVLTGAASLAELAFFRVDAVSSPPNVSLELDGFQRLPTPASTSAVQLTDQTYLITTSGTFGISVSATNLSFFADIPVLVTFPPATGSIGTYAFTLSVEDSGSSGFAATTGATDPTVAGSVPFTTDFTTPGQAITVAASSGPAFVYRLRTMANGGQIVWGTNGNGINSTRTAGADGVINNGDDLLNLTSDSGDGTDIVAAPRPSEFVGVDNTLGTADDLAFINRDGFRWAYTTGANGVVNGNGSNSNRSDDAVIGTDKFGNTITQTPGANGIFGDTDDLVSVGASNGRPVTAGVPGQLASDVHIYNLNGSAQIAANTRYRATLRVNQDGGNLGLRAPQPVLVGESNTFGITDLRGLVQFAVFDRTAAVAIDDGNVVVSPDKVGGFGGTANRLISADSQTRYGYDEQGDFYIEFTLPPSIANNAVAGSYALYIQGAINSNYKVEILNRGVTAQAATVKRQNFLIETRGGQVDWLEVGSRTLIQGWDPEINGFTGRVNGIPVLDYVLGDPNNINPNNLIAQLNAIFAAIPGFAADTVEFSTNPADFEGEVFSTIFLSNTFESSAFFNSLETLDPTGVSRVTPTTDVGFGAIQRVDPFNSNKTDQGVVFMQALNLLGNAPTVAGIDRFTQQLAGTVARQAAQLLGLRISAGASGAPVDPTGDGAVTQPPGIGGAYRFDSFSTRLNPPTLLSTFNTNGQFNPLNPLNPFVSPGSNTLNSNTQFFLGRQTSEILLQRIFRLG